METRDSYWNNVWKKFYRHRLGKYAFFLIILFCLMGIYAPFLASSKPLFLQYHQQAYFPLFRYLFFQGFFTKRLDLFFNLMIFTVPLAFLGWLFFRHSWRKILLLAVFIQVIAFIYLINFPLKDPAFNATLVEERHQALQQLRKSGKIASWDFDLKFMNDYARLNMLIKYINQKRQHVALSDSLEAYQQAHQRSIPTLWQVEQDNQAEEIARLQAKLKEEKITDLDRQRAEAQLQYIFDRRQWLEQESQQIRFYLMPLLSSFHYEDDAGGQQALNQFVDWWHLTRINRKDLLSALIFGVRISLVVGLVSVFLALLIGIPIGALAGFYGGKVDIVVSRLLEIWEAMPVFFMLLMVVGILQNKSIFLVITVIGLFGWTGFSRYIRGEFFKQRNLPYVEAGRSIGFNDGYIMFKHILPNSLPPILTLLPFAIMGAITSEAGLSFLGLGEENSSSWGVLMDEGRSAFPAESYLLWPPAILLTILLVAIALVGDSLRDTLDPKKSG